MSYAVIPYDSKNDNDVQHDFTIHLRLKNFKRDNDLYKNF